MRKTGLTLLLFLVLLSSRAQSTKVELHLNPVFNAQELVPEKMGYDANTRDSIRIDVLQFYVSGICFYDHDSLVAKADGLFHLFDLGNPASRNISCVLPHPVRYDKVTFQIGIDSLTNVSGVFGGDLDPVKGMYWAWQSGYINFKLEGYSPLCKTRNHKFQFHLGGYQWPYASIQTVELICPATSGTLNLELNLNAFLNPINLSAENQIMSPGEKSVLFSTHIPAMFRLIR